MSADHGRVLREEKQAMFAKQAAARERDRPLDDRSHLAHAKALLANLEKVSPNIPPRIVLNGPPAGAFEKPVTPPEPMGGCFSDIAEDTRGNHEIEEASSEEDAEDNP